MALDIEFPPGQGGLPASFSNDIESVNSPLSVAVKSWLKKRGKHVAKKLTDQQKEEFYQCFKLIDEDGSGAIDTGELQHAFRLLGINMSLREVVSVVAEVDRDEGGEVEYSEFIDVMTDVLDRIAKDAEEQGKMSGASVPFSLMSTAYRRKRLMGSITAGRVDVLKQIEKNEERRRQEAERAAKQKEKEEAELLSAPASEPSSPFMPRQPNTPSKTCHNPRMSQYLQFRPPPVGIPARMHSSPCSFSSPLEGLSPCELAAVKSVIHLHEKEAGMQRLIPHRPGVPHAVAHRGASRGGTSGDATLEAARLGSQHGDRRVPSRQATQHVRSPSALLPSSPSRTSVPSIASTPKNMAMGRGGLSSNPAGANMGFSSPQRHRDLLQSPASNINIKFSRPTIKLPNAISGPNASRNQLHSSSATFFEPPNSIYSAPTPAIEFDPNNIVDDSELMSPPAASRSVSQPSILALSQAPPSSLFSPASLELSSPRSPNGPSFGGMGLPSSRGLAAEMGAVRDPRSRAKHYAEKLRAETTEVFLTNPSSSGSRNGAPLSPATSASSSMSGFHPTHPGASSSNGNNSTSTATSTNSNSGSNNGSSSNSSSNNNNSNKTNNNSNNNNNKNKNDNKPSGLLCVVGSRAGEEGEGSNGSTGEHLTQCLPSSPGMSNNLPHLRGGKKSRDAQANDSHPEPTSKGARRQADPPLINGSGIRPAKPRPGAHQSPSSNSPTLPSVETARQKASLS